MMYNNDPYLNDFENRIEAARQRENEAFDLQPPEGFESDEDSVEIEIEDDGQPTEYEEWQDVYGGDDWDHGQYDHDYYDGGVDF